MPHVIGHKEEKKKPRVPTPEEEAEQKRKGSEFIRAREKRLSELKQAGVTGKKALAQATREIESGRREEEQRVEAQRLEAQRLEEGKQFLEEQGVLEERAPPVRAELDIPERGGGIEGSTENLPLVGPSIGAVNQVWIDVIRDGGFGKKILKAPEPLIQDPVTLREMALQEIQKQTIAEGLSVSEKFGALVESIPFGVGSAVSKFAGRMIESPKENVDTIVSDIDELGQIATNLREKALSGKTDPFEAIILLNKFEENLIKLETRIQLLSLESAVLRADADQLNKIETSILDNKIRINDAKTSAAAGVLAPASDANVFLTLQGLKGGA